MPTCGSTYEDVRDHLFITMDKRRVPTKPTVYACPYCDKKFKLGEARRRHLGLYHPLDLPLLEVSGVSLPTRSIFRHALKEADVNIYLATQCRIKKVGGEWEALKIEQVGKQLASLNDSSWILELVNKRDVDESTR